MRDDISQKITRRMLTALGFSVTVTLALIVSSGMIESRLGAPQYWPWLLTGLQVLSLWAAGAKRWWGWPLGAAVQPPWIAYALLTGQLGFIPGCAISAMVQSYSFIRSKDKERGTAMRIGPIQALLPRPSAQMTGHASGARR